MAMIDAYTIGVELVLGGDLAAGIEALVPALAQLDGGLAQANTTAKALAAALTGLAATAPGLGQAAQAMERLNAAMMSMHVAAAQQPSASVPKAGPVPGTTLETAARGTAEPDQGRLTATPAPLGIATSARTEPMGVPARGAPQPMTAAQALVHTVAIPMPRMAGPGASMATPSPHPPPPAASPPPTALPAYAQDALMPRAAAPIEMRTAESANLVHHVAAQQSPAAARLTAPIVPPPLQTVLPHVQAAEPRPAPPNGRMVTRESFIGLRDALLPRTGPVEPAAAASRTNPAQAVASPTLPHAIVAPASFETKLAPIQAIPKAAPQPLRPAKAVETAAAAIQAQNQALRGLAAARPSRMEAMPQWLRYGTPASALATAPSVLPMQVPAGQSPARPRRPTSDNLAQLQSYHPQSPQPGSVIQHVTYVQLDERTIARAVTRHQLRMMGGQVSGTLRPDPSIAPQYGAHLLEM